MGTGVAVGDDDGIGSGVSVGFGVGVGPGSGELSLPPQAVIVIAKTTIANNLKIMSCNLGRYHYCKIGLANKVIIGITNGALLVMITCNKKKPKYFILV